MSKIIFGTFKRKMKYAQVAFGMGSQVLSSEHGKGKTATCKDCLGVSYHRLICPMNKIKLFLGIFPYV